MSDDSSYVYQVLDWDRLFENNKSRERDQLHFVCVPNKQDGMGLTRVLTHPNGAAIYGIWQLILGACSRQNRPRDGWLTDTGRAPDGQEAGTPWAPADLALRWRRPVAEIEEALRVLSAPNIHWINALTLKVPAECPPSARIVPAECLGREGNGTGGNGREMKEGNICQAELDVCPPKEKNRLPPEIEFWNANCGGLPKVLSFSSDRKKRLADRRKDSFWVENYQKAILQIQTSEFCNGKNDRGWKASFDWIIERPKAVASVIEGKFSNKPLKCF